MSLHAPSPFQPALKAASVPAARSNRGLSLMLRARPRSWLVSGRRGSAVRGPCAQQTESTHSTGSPSSPWDLTNPVPWYSSRRRQTAARGGVGEAQGAPRASKRITKESGSRQRPFPAFRRKTINKKQKTGKCTEAVAPCINLGCSLACTPEAPYVHLPTRPPHWPRTPQYSVVTADGYNRLRIVPEKQASTGPHLRPPDTVSLAGRILRLRIPRGSHES